jgi:zinc protease
MRGSGRSRESRSNHRTRIAWALALVFVLAVPLDVLGKEPPSTEVQRATLDNGLRVIVVRNTLAPVAATVVNYLAGSNEAPEGFPGMAHAQEHMMFRGSPGLTASQLADIVAAMGGVFNADTQQTVTQYFFTVPAEDLDVALHVELMRMGGALDDEKLWQQEKGAIKQEVAQDLSNPEYIFYERLLASLFKGTPYEHSPLGTTASFDKTSGAMLKKFYDTWYVPNNAVLVIVGDVDPSDTLNRVKKLFGALPARKGPARAAIQLQAVQPETIRLQTDRPVGTVVVAFRMPGYDSNDYAASVVLSDVLSSRRGDFYNLVVEGKAISVDFSLDTLPQTGLGYATAVFPNGADPQPLMDAVKQILQTAATKGFPADLVEAAKHQELTSAESRKNSVFGLAMAWSQAVAVEDRSSPDEDTAAIQKVTAEAVNDVAKRYLDLNHTVTAILTPEESGEPVAARGSRGMESLTPRHTENATLPDWAQAAVKRLDIPRSTLNPTVAVLPNGLKLIVQPESISRTVTVLGHVRNQPKMESPEGKEGVDQVLEELFGYGTTTLDRVAFQKALDDIGASASSGTDFSLEVLADHFDRGVELLADNLLHPALPQAAFAIVRRQVAGVAAGQLRSPGYLAAQALERSLFPKDDPSLRETTSESVTSLTPQDVNDYYRRVFRPDLTTIVVIGHTTPEQARAAVEKHFGSWQSTGSKPDVLLPPVPNNKSAAATVPDASRVQNKVTLAETVGLVRSDPNYYPLELGNHVLGGGFYATRLYQDLRESSGLVYNVSSIFELGRTRGVYIVRYACDPANVDKVRTIVQQNLKRMQTEPASADEIQTAKAMLLREIPLSESSVEQIAEGFISRVNLDLPLDEPSRAAQRYAPMTAEQVRAAFNRWIRPDDLVLISQGPSPK